MKSSVLLDTSFFISLVDSNRANHNAANQYYKLLLDLSIPIYFSAIVAAEFGIKQPITDLPFKNFRILPFNITHSIEAAQLWNLLDGRDSGDNRSVVRDDMKIIAQALHEKIPFILTDDTKTFYKYCERLRVLNNLNIRAIKLVDGFDASALRLDGQKSIDVFI
jgi:PIN domain nuclease of toxin-antitoxin system